LFINEIIEIFNFIHTLPPNVFNLLLSETGLDQFQDCCKIYL
jgi:hypothetical protein